MLLYFILNYRPPAVLSATAGLAEMPVGSQALVIESTSLYQCGEAYYQASGGQYVMVNVT